MWVYNELKTRNGTPGPNYYLVNEKGRLVKKTLKALTWPPITTNVTLLPHMLNNSAHKRGCVARMIGLCRAIDIYSFHQMSLQGLLAIPHTQTHNTLYVNYIRTKVPTFHHMK